MTFNPIEAISKVVERRIERGATKESIEGYKKHLLTVWKGEGMQEFINSINYDQVKEQQI